MTCTASQVEIDQVQQSMMPAQDVLIRSRSKIGGLRLTLPVVLRSLVEGKFHLGWRFFANGTMLLVLSTSNDGRMTVEECQVRHVS